MVLFCAYFAFNLFFFVAGLILFLKSRNNCTDCALVTPTVQPSAAAEVMSTPGTPVSQNSEIETTETPTSEPTNTPVPTATPTRILRSYTVKSGDSCWGITQMFGITLDEFIEANNLTQDCILLVGRNVVIP